MTKNNQVFCGGSSTFGLIAADKTSVPENPSF